MKAQKTQTLIEDILELSKSCDSGLREKIKLLMDIQQSDSSEKETLLENRISEEIDKRVEREKVLQSQAKMAAMGEMMDAVAHQWKQPLNALSMYGDLLKMDFKAGEVTENYINDFVSDIQEQINQMVSTLSEFRTFFSPDKDPEPFGLKRCIQAVQLLIHDEMLRYRINIDVESRNEIIITGSENQFKHLLLNLLSNAKEAFASRNVTERTVYIRFFKQDGSVIVEVEDTAGGIEAEDIDDIFEPGFTTKDDGKGTGIGLYISTQIAQKMNGSLTAENTEKGALFRLTIPLS